MNGRQSPIALALDTNSKEEALQLAQTLKPWVGVYKVGPRLTNRFGPQIISELAHLGPVFVDHKYYDIPSTTLEAVQSIFELGASYVTVHASVGMRTLEQLASLERVLNQKRPFKILVVTVLTSLESRDFPSWMSNISLKTCVQDYMSQVAVAKLTGVVCSPYEISLAKKIIPNAFIVTPGIRLEKNCDDDQDRVATPQEALQAGASLLVIGRPILMAPSPAQMAEQIFQSLISQREVL